jgi:branched-chain amino acid transport system substrate-binding protein
MSAHPGNRLVVPRARNARGGCVIDWHRHMKPITAIVALASVLVVAGLLAAQAPSQGPSDRPIRIGFVGPLSGAYAQNGRDILNGMLLYLDQIGSQAAGRKIEVIAEDDEAVPANSLTKARKLVERDGVDVMAGGLLSSTGYALAPYIESRKIPMIYPVISADDLTQRLHGKWIIRTGYTGSQPNHPFGEYAYHTLKLRKVATIALDYAFGWESVGGFQRTFEAEGGQVTQKLWTPVLVHDFAPYLAQIPRDVDAVYALFLGRSALQFMRQYQEFGLRKRILLIGAGPTTDEHVLPAMGDEAIGTITVLHYSAALDTPANRAFVPAYRLKYNKLPSYYAESMYSGAKWLVAAIEAVHGRVEDREAFLQALKTVKPTDLPRGPVELDDYGNPVENFYVRKVERVNGALQNTVIATFAHVSQFWKYDPASYLSLPLYTRQTVPPPPALK